MRAAGFKSATPRLHITLLMVRLSPTMYSYAPKALYPLRTGGYIRSSDAMGSWYYRGGAAVARAAPAAPLSFVERFAKHNAQCTWKQSLMRNDPFPRRWVGGPVITPPVAHPH